MWKIWNSCILLVGTCSHYGKQYGGSSEIKNEVTTLCCAQSLSRVRLFAIPGTAAHRAPGGFSRQEYSSGLPCPPPGGLPNSAIKPRSPTMQAGSLPSQQPEKLKNTGVGSLSLLQQIFPTQESNQGLPHCRWILYQLSYQGSIYIMENYSALKRNQIFIYATTGTNFKDILLN